VISILSILTISAECINTVVFASPIDVMEPAHGRSAFGEELAKLLCPAPVRGRGDINPQYSDDLC